METQQRALQWNDKPQGKSELLYSNSAEYWIGNVSLIYVNFFFLILKLAICFSFSLSPYLSSVFFAEHPGELNRIV